MTIDPLLAWLLSTLVGVGIGFVIERHLANERRWRAEDRAVLKELPAGATLILNADRELSFEQRDAIRAALEPALARAGCKLIVVPAGFRADVAPTGASE